jgi:UDP-N-acetylglucosamine 2-epimerase (non-hydrolysing)
MMVLSVVGARPQFVKLAPVAAALAKAGHEHVIVHTGQHYDARMSDVFFTDLRIPEPDLNLGVGSDAHGAQTGAMLAALESVLVKHQPDWVLVYGDTNSTLAGAVAAVKVHLPVAHVEAGLRSFNRRMPEEHNRVLADHAADLLLAPTPVAMAHLAREGLASRAVLVGDVMADLLLQVRDAVASEPPPLPAEIIGAAGGYVVATVHRAENTDDPARLRVVIRALADLDVPVALPAHPRLVARAAATGIDLATGAVRPLPPLSYPGLVSVVLHARGVVTDSGGLQKEAFLLGVPCTTLRGETEWTETLEGGWNVLDPDLAKVRTVAVRAAPAGPRTNPYGDGQTATRVVDVLERYVP